MVGLQFLSVDTHGVQSSHDATGTTHARQGPHATRKSEAQLLLPSVDAVRADLRLYSAIKSSTSSLVFFLHRLQTRLKISLGER